MKSRMSSYMAFLLSGIAATYGQSDSESAEANSMQQELQLIDYSKPEYVEDSLYPTGETHVFGTAQYNDADVVLLDGGSDRGFRTGMLCDVSNETGIFARIVLVEVEEDRSAGLIIEFVDDESIKFGNLVKIKTVRY